MRLGQDGSNVVPRQQVEQVGGHHTIYAFGGAVKPQGAVGLDDGGALPERGEPITGDLGHAGTQVPTYVSGLGRAVRAEEAFGKPARPASDLQNRLRVIEGAVGDEHVEGWIFVERLRILPPPDTVVDGTGFGVGERASSSHKDASEGNGQTGSAW